MEETYTKDDITIDDGLTVGIVTYVPSDLHWRVKNKCKFYDIGMKNIIIFFLRKFMDGDFDEELGIKK